ncbi:MAG: hypothetical protein R2709_06565 [Marmoricola sp.]
MALSQEQPKGIGFERRCRSLRQRMLPETEDSTVVEFAIADTHDALLQALATLRVDLDVIHPAFSGCRFGHRADADSGGR